MQYLAVMSTLVFTSRATHYLHDGRIVTVIKRHGSKCTIRQDYPKMFAFEKDDSEVTQERDVESSLLHKLRKDKIPAIRLEGRNKHERNESLASLRMEMETRQKRIASHPYHFAHCVVDWKAQEAIRGVLHLPMQSRKYQRAFKRTLKRREFKFIRWLTGQVLNLEKTFYNHYKRFYPYAPKQKSSFWKKSSSQKDKYDKDYLKDCDLVRKYANMLVALYKLANDPTQPTSFESDGIEDRVDKWLRELLEDTK